MEDLSLFWSAVIGGVITGGFSILAVLCAHRKERERQNQQEGSLIKSLLQSIHDEIETLWEIYQEGMGTRIESLPENQPLALFYPVTQDYFTVYHGNSFLIGRIKDNDLRKLIITTYTRAKGLIDSYRLNNDFTQKCEQLHWLFRQTGNLVFEQQLNAQLAVMIDYAKKIKESHNKVKDNVSALLRELRKSGVLSER